MSEKTIHKSTTPHSSFTPHKYPTIVISILDILNKLSRQLYPTGRAWYRTEDGTWERFHEAINKSFARVVEDGDSLIDGTFPDNDNFTFEDAGLWEYRLGLITNLDLSLEVRKAAIKRKLGHPNNIKARQHPLFIQSQLQNSGFNVWVHENTIPYKTPEEVLGLLAGSLQHSDSTEHSADTEHRGGDVFGVIANSIEEIEDFDYGVGNEWATFFLGAEILGGTANVPESRLREFKELVIKLKPAHTVAFTFINYT